MRAGVRFVRSQLVWSNVWHSKINQEPGLSIMMKARKTKFSFKISLGDLVLVLPGIFHQGFNTGYNYAEARNIATPEWMENYARWATCCDSNTCNHGATAIRLDVDDITQKFRAAKQLVF